MALILDASAQDSKVTYNYHEYNSKNDFYGTNIGTFYQDSLGFMWFGCEGGLYLHDGVKIEEMLNFADTLGYTGQRNPAIQCIIEDEQGYFWFGYFYTLIKFDPATLKYKSYQLEHGRIFSLYKGKESLLWLGTGEGLVRFDSEKELVTNVYNANPQDYYFPDKWKEFVSEQWPQNKLIIYDIQPDPSDKGLWLGANWGLYFFNIDSKQFSAHYPERFPGDKELKIDDLLCNINPDPDGTFWIGLSKWLYKFDPDSHDFDPVFTHIPDYPIDKDILRVYADVDPLNSHKLWIKFKGEGIMVFDKNQRTIEWVLHKTEQTKFLPSISFHSFDNQGNLWVGSLMDGLIVVNPVERKFDYIKELSEEGWFSTPGYMLRSIDVSPKNKIWIGGGNYLSYYDLENNFLNPNMFKEDRCFNIVDFSARGIHLMKVDPYGNVWTANTYCVKKFEPGTETSTIYQPSDYFNWIHTIIWDKYEFAWIADAKWNIYRLNPETGESVKLTKEKNGSSDKEEQLWQVVQDANGNLFFCGDHSVKKLEILEDKDETDIHIDDYRFVDVIPIDMIEDKIGPEKDGFSRYKSTFGVDTKGNLWIGTNNNGIIMYDQNRDSIRFYTEKDGLADNTVNSLILDNNDRLWIGCAYGLSCLDQQTGEIINFYENDGLISARFSFNNWTFTNGSAIDEDGNIYMGITNGVTYFNPEEILENVKEHPNLVLSGLYINNNIIYPSNDDGPIDKSISYLPDIHLKYTHKLVSLQYSVPDYTDRSKRIHYNHKLVGYDDQWIDAGKRTFITYSNIPPGKYQLKINTSYTYNFYEENAVSINIIMAPPPWATWWAYTLYVLFALGAIWAFIAWRTHDQKRKLLEVEKVNKRLKQVDQLKDQFLANTSHELRTPLQGIIGLAESLKDGIAGTLPPKAIENLNMINSSGKRLANLVNDILDFSKMKKHDLELQLKPTDIRSVVEVVITILQPLIKSKDIKLTYDIPDDLPYVIADENRLQQILHNLLGNAFKFTEKGSIRLSAEVIEGMVAIKVADTGIGIPKDKQKGIFKSFEQAEGGISREYGGTGLGLSVTKQLVKLHGGKINLHSEPDTGSTFTFTLPVSDEKVAEKEIIDTELIKGHAGEEEAGPEVIEETETIEEIESSPLNGRVDILVVDDEPINLHVLKNHLSLEGYHVTLANNGIEAMELIEGGNKYDLIILDIMMPKLSGYEVCQKLRELFLPSELPVVMLTAKNQVLDLVDGFNTGANDYLTKPFSKDELLSRIKTHLNLQRIHRATGKFVPYEFLRAIGRDSITEVNLGDQVHKEVSILFLDILEYTSLSENMTPEENFLFINEFVGQLGPVIAENNGFVNQYIGDAIMAIFPEKAEDGLKAAVEMQKKLDEFNNERIKEGKKEIRIGIGLHTGPLIMGIIGDKHHAEPTTIADTVNISSRLEGLTRQYGVRIIVSESSIQHMKDPEKFHLRYLGQVLVKGKQKPIKMYECVDGDKETILKLKGDLQKDFDKGLNHFYKKEFPEASVVFNNIIKQNTDDHASAYFYSRAARYAADGVSEDWTGVERWDMK